MCVSTRQLGRLFGTLLTLIQRWEPSRLRWRMLLQIGTQAQAETWAAHAQRVQAIQQRDGAYRLVEAREEARTRTMVLAGRMENDYRRREAEYRRQIQEHQNTVE